MILAYHEFSATPERDVYAVTPEVFRGHLRLLPEQRCTRFPITFDDGHRSQFEIAAPLLHEAGIRGMFFIATAWIGEKPTAMRWSEIAELARAGHVIGSHTHNHPLLTSCSYSEVIGELRTSRDILEQVLGIRIYSISMPGGRVNARVLAACAEVGYTCVYTSRPGEHVSSGAGMPRVYGRLMVRRTSREKQLASYLAGDARTMNRLEFEYMFKSSVKALAGDSLYQWLWRKAVRAPSLGPLQGGDFSAERPANKS